MKIQLSVKVDELVGKHAKRQTNTSRYVETLIKHDMQIKAQEPIYQAVMQRLLTDSQMLSDLRLRLAQEGPATVNKYFDTSYAPAEDVA